LPLLLFPLLSTVPYVLSVFSCPNNFVCDPSVGTDIFLTYYHLADEDQCEESCTIGHPNNPCKFFTWVPHTEAHVPNCFHMSECVELSNPSHGEKSGAWSCDDQAIFCPAVGPLPHASHIEAHWSCDHEVYPYGNSQAFQDVVCRTSCPSFEYEGSPSQGSAVVVSSTCKYNRTSGRAEWSPAVPGNVVDSHGVLIESAGANPVLRCGCQDLVVKGTVEHEAGKYFSCNTVLAVTKEGDTVFTDETECTLLCAGTHLWDLSCVMGSWLPYNIETAADISCFFTTTTTMDPTQTGTTGGHSATLSTFWPPGHKNRIRLN